MRALGMVLSEKPHICGFRVCIFVFAHWKFLALITSNWNWLAGVSFIYCTYDDIIPPITNMVFLRKPSDEHCSVLTAARTYMILWYKLNGCQIGCISLTLPTSNVFVIVHIVQLLL